MGEPRHRMCAKWRSLDKAVGKGPLERARWPRTQAVPRSTLALQRCERGSSSSHAGLAHPCRSSCAPSSGRAEPCGAAACRARWKPQPDGTSRDRQAPRLAPPGQPVPPHKPFRARSADPLTALDDASLQLQRRRAPRRGREPRAPRRGQSVRRSIATRRRRWSGITACCRRPSPARTR